MGFDDEDLTKVEFNYCYLSKKHITANGYCFSEPEIGKRLELQDDNGNPVITTSPVAEIISMAVQPKQKAYMVKTKSGSLYDCLFVHR